MKNEDKIKTELFKKIFEHEDVENKIYSIESETKLSFTQLIEEGGEYSELCTRKLELEKEIDDLIIQTIYFPLIGLNDMEKQKIDFSRISHSLDYEEIIETHFDTQLLNFNDDMKRRLKKLKGLYLIIKPDKRVMKLYKEIVRCYIFELYFACIALCRALVENVAEEYCMQNKEDREKIIGAKNHEKRLMLSKILEKKITKELYKAYSNIGKEGASVLHWRRDKISEGDALKIIEDSYKFINEIYKTPDFSHLIEDV